MDMSDTANFHFRTALHGFHREDVVRYIDQMTQANEADTNEKPGL